VVSFLIKETIKLLFYKIVEILKVKENENVWEKRWTKAQCVRSAGAKGKGDFFYYDLLFDNLYTVFMHEGMFTVYLGIHAIFDKLLSKYHINCIR